MALLKLSSTPYTLHPRPYILYGRRKGKKLRAGKTALMETLLPRLTLPEDDPLDPHKTFPKVKEIWLEVGFGAGEHLAEQAKCHPDIGFIGCEIFVNGIAGLLGRIEAGKLQNIRIHPADARPLLDRLKPGSLAKIFVLFPDPWPKKRHIERRFIGPDNLPKLARALKAEGELRLASDDPTMQEWLVEQMALSQDFTPAPGLMHRRPQDWPQTRYEEKAFKAGRKPFYWIFSRKK